MFQRMNVPIQIDEVRYTQIQSLLQKEKPNTNDIKKLFDVSKNLEGLLRHASTHAAGIVISDEDLTKSLPLKEKERLLTPPLT